MLPKKRRAKPWRNERRSCLDLFYSHFDDSDGRERLQSEEDSYRPHHSVVREVRESVSGCSDRRPVKPLKLTRKLKAKSALKRKLATRPGPQLPI